MDDEFQDGEGPGGVASYLDRRSRRAYEQAMWDAIYGAGAAAAGTVLAPVTNGASFPVAYGIAGLNAGNAVSNAADGFLKGMSAEKFRGMPEGPSDGRFHPPMRLGGPEGSFDLALSRLSQALIDLDGDGVPDVAVPQSMVQQTQMPEPPPAASSNAMAQGRRPTVAAEPASRPADPSEAGDVMAGAALGAVDVLGIPSAIAGRVFGPEVKNAMRGPQERNPNAAMVGALLSPANAMAAGLGIARGAQLAGRGVKAMEGARNAMAVGRPGVAAPYLDEAEQILVQPGSLVRNMGQNVGTGAVGAGGADYLDRGELDTELALRATAGGMSGGLGTVGGFVGRRGADPLDEIQSMRSRVPSAADLERAGVPGPYRSGPPIRKPQGEGLEPVSKKGREEASEFYSELYDTTQRGGGPRLPEHVRGIEETPHGYRGPGGRFVTHETGMTAKKLGFPKKR